MNKIGVQSKMSISRMQNNWDGSDSGDRIICNLLVNTTLPLPESAPWRGRNRQVDLYVRPGSIRCDFGQPTELAFVRISSDRTLLLGEDHGPRFLVTATSVVVDTSKPDWRRFLLGPVIGAVCNLRGFLPLHASAVRFDSRAVAFAGPSGAGKSTLAAALAARGHILVSDEICPVDGISSVPIALPSLPAQKLSWRSIELLGIDTASVSCISSDTEEFHLSVEIFDPTPAPLEVVYLLEKTEDDSAEEIVTLSGIEAAYRLNEVIYRPDIGAICCSRASLFTKTARLADKIPVRRLLSRGCSSDPETLVARIESDILTLRNSL